MTTFLKARRCPNCGQGFQGYYCLDCYHACPKCHQTTLNGYDCPNCVEVAPTPLMGLGMAYLIFFGSAIVLGTLIGVVIWFSSPVLQAAAFAIVAALGL